MKLDRFYNISCICTAVFLCLPFLIDELIADIPRWGWQVMTALIVVSGACMAVSFFMRKSRDWDEKHGRSTHRRK